MRERDSALRAIGRLWHGNCDRGDDYWCGCGRAIGPDHDRGRPAALHSADRQSSSSLSPSSFYLHSFFSVFFIFHILSFRSSPSRSFLFSLPLYRPKHTHYARKCDFDYRLRDARSNRHRLSEPVDLPSRASITMALEA